MGVKQMWRKHLGDFRDEDRKLIASLPDERIVVDVSAWMHMLDGVWAVQYARTSTPRYSHPAIVTFFSARHRALEALKLQPIYVFDGMSPNMKKRTNRMRQQKASASRDEYKTLIGEINSTGRAVTEEERSKLLRLRRDTARPTPEDYASLAQWMGDNQIPFRQAPFEADAEMKQIIMEGGASAAITEDGDLVVFDVEHILSQTKIDTLAPKDSTCQYFDMKELKDGAYDSPIAIGRRSEFLAEISCLSGNDYIDNIYNIGSAAIFGTHKKRKDQKALIDSFIEDTAIQKTKSEREWLENYWATHNKKKESEDGECDPEAWSVDRFLHVRNLIRHYPVLKRNDSGSICLAPLTPLPSNIEYCDWGSYIGFDKHPSEHFHGIDLQQYSNMTIVGSTMKPRSELLGPRYTVDDNPEVDTNDLLPLFATLSFDDDPIDVQPTAVLKAYLLARGVTMPQNTSPEKIRELAHSAHDAALRGKRPVMHPSLVPKPAKWVGFEPLDDLELGDKYDDWVSCLCPC